MEIRDGKKYFQVQMALRNLLLGFIFFGTCSLVFWNIPNVAVSQPGHEVLEKYCIYFFMILSLLCASFAMLGVISYIKCRLMPTFIVIDTEYVRFPFFPFIFFGKIKLADVVAVRPDPNGFGRQVVIHYKRRLAKINAGLFSSSDEFQDFVETLKKVRLA